MNFAYSTEPLTFEQRVHVEAERLANRRTKTAERRKARHDGFHDAETIEVPRPEGPKTCTVDDCDRPHHGRGLCSTHLKRQRRSRGLAN